jgi:hypothetical protein
VGAGGAGGGGGGGEGVTSGGTMGIWVGFCTMKVVVFGLVYSWEWVNKPQSQPTLLGH